MARIRSLKPEFWDDRKLARRVSRDARLLYLALWNQADEWARCRGDAKYVRGSCLPYEDDLTDADVDGLLDELAGLERIVRYEEDDEIYLYLPKLAKHQRLEPNKTPSRHPAPPAEQFAPCVEPVKEDLGLFAQVTEVPEPYADESEISADKSAPMQVAGSRGQVASSREQVASDDAGAPASNRRGTRIPENFAINPSMRLWAADHVPTVDVDHATDEFVDYWRGVPGVRGTNLNWVATWRNRMRKVAEWQAAKRPTTRAGPAGDGLTSGERKALAALEAGRRLQARHDGTQDQPQRHQLER